VLCEAKSKGAKTAPPSSKAKEKIMGFAQTHERKVSLDPLQKAPPTPSLFEGAPSPVGRSKGVAF